MRGIYIILLGWCCLSFTNTEVCKTAALSDENVTLPKVFILGEHESDYEQLMLQYNTSLLTACDNDMQVAFSKLNGMFQEIEAYAEQMHYDIKGVKLWVHIFWDKDGSINHLGYHLRPNSKNVDTSELTTFLESFIEQYRFPLTTDTNYTLYTSTSYPTRYAGRTSKKQ